MRTAEPDTFVTTLAGEAHGVRLGELPAAAIASETPAGFATINLFVRIVAWRRIRQSPAHFRVQWYGGESEDSTCRGQIAGW